MSDMEYEIRINDDYMHSRLFSIMKQFNGNVNLWNNNIENQREACWNHKNDSNMKKAQWLLNIIYNHTYANRNTEIIRTGGD